MVEDVCPFPGARPNRPLPLFLPCSTWISCKSFPVVRHRTKTLLISVDAVVGLKLLATTLADKHMVTVLPNHVLVRH